MIVDALNTILKLPQCAVTLGANCFHLLFNVAAQQNFFLSKFLLNAPERLLTCFFINACNHVLGEIQHTVKVSAADVQLPGRRWVATGA